MGDGNVEGALGMCLVGDEGADLSTSVSLVGGLSLVGGRLALGGNSGNGASGAGVGWIELHIDCDRDRTEDALEFAMVVCGI